MKRTENRKFQDAEHFSVCYQTRSLCGLIAGCAQSRYKFLWVEGFILAGDVAIIQSHRIYSISSGCWISLWTQSFHWLIARLSLTSSIWVLGPGILNPPLPAGKTRQGSDPKQQSVCQEPEEYSSQARGQVQSRSWTKHCPLLGMLWMSRNSKPRSFVGSDETHSCQLTELVLQPRFCPWGPDLCQPSMQFNPSAAVKGSEAS